MIMKIKKNDVINDKYGRSYRVVEIIKRESEMRQDDGDIFKVGYKVFNLYPLDVEPTKADELALNNGYKFMPYLNVTDKVLATVISSISRDNNIIYI